MLSMDIIQDIAPLHLSLIHIFVADIMRLNRAHRLIDFLLGGYGILDVLVGHYGRRRHLAHLNIIPFGRYGRGTVSYTHLDVYKRQFESFHFGRVSGYFEKNKDFLLPHDVAIIVAQLTCYQGHLPQGAPSSPIITNLICQIFDMRILKIAKKYKLDYTRYADDLTFSTHDRSFAEKKKLFIEELEAEIVKAGFAINQKKTRMCLRDSQQMVTGLVVNQKINVNAEYCRTTRAMAHQLYTTGSFQNDGREGTLAQLEGRFSFINQLDHYNNKIDGEKHSFRTLNAVSYTHLLIAPLKTFISLEHCILSSTKERNIIWIKMPIMIR